MILPGRHDRDNPRLLTRGRCRSPGQWQGPDMRLRTLSLLPTLLALSGCFTHLSLRNNTVRTTDTLTDLNYRQILDNLAMFSANAAAMPSIAVINAGTVTV